MKEDKSSNQSAVQKRFNQILSEIHSNWETTFQSPRGWFKATSEWFSNTQINKVKARWNILSDKKIAIHSKAGSAVRLSFKTVEYGLRGLGILFSDSVMIALVVLRNSAVFLKDIGMTLSFGLSLAAEGLTWCIATPIQKLMARLSAPEKNKTKSAQPEQNSAISPETQAPNSGFSAEFKKDENGYNISANFNFGPPSEPKEEASKATRLKRFTQS